MPSPSPLVVGVRSQDTKSVCILTEDTDAFLIQQAVPEVLPAVVCWLHKPFISDHRSLGSFFHRGARVAPLW